MSNDHAGTWSRLLIATGNKIARSMTIDANNRVFVGTNGEGVYRSTDIGATWTQVNAGLGGLNVTSLVSTQTGQLIAAVSGTGSGVYVSANGGATWVLRSKGVNDYSLWCLAASSDGGLFLGTANGVYSSANQGLDWQLENAGLSETFVYSLAMRDDDYLYAGTNGGGVYRSIRPTVPLPIQMTSFHAEIVASNMVELKWATVSETNNFGFYVQRRAVTSQYFIELPSSFVPGHGTTIAAQEYCFTDSAVTPGIWFYRIKQVDLDGSIHLSDPIQANVIASVQDRVPLAFTLSQNYPNPFNPSTNIRYGLPTKSHVSLYVYNTLGQQVATLVNENQEAGYHDVRLDGNNLASGVYFYRLQTENFLQTRKLILLR
jgi:hypothetical protein